MTATESMEQPAVEYLEVRDYEKLKHYHHRENLPWIKISQGLMDDPAFLSVDATQRGLYIMMCLLAARLGNRILYEPSYLGRAMRLDGPPDIGPLINAGLLKVVSGSSTKRRLAKRPHPSNSR